MLCGCVSLCAYVCMFVLGEEEGGWEGEGGEGESVERGGEGKGEGRGGEVERGEGEGRGKGGGGEGGVEGEEGEGRGV